MSSGDRFPTWEIEVGFIRTDPPRERLVSLAELNAKLAREGWEPVAGLPDLFGIVVLLKRRTS